MECFNYGKNIARRYLMTGEGSRKNRDPIFTVCFIVFLIACVAVLGSYVNSEYIEEDETIVAKGDTVTVNYTGTLYAPYGENSAVVFDTTLQDVGENDDVKKSNEYSRVSFDTIDVTVGKGSYLADFENCLIGHKVGDTVTVEIPNAYIAASSEKTADFSQSIPMVQPMTKEIFDSLYDDVTLVGGTAVPFTSAYGWEAFATYDVAENMVYITYLPEEGSSYEYVGNEDSDFGKVAFKVTSVSDGIIEFTMSFSELTYLDGNEIQMLSLNLDGTTVYVKEVNESAETYTYKICGEVYNETLYFVLEIVAIS